MHVLHMQACMVQVVFRFQVDPDRSGVTVVDNRLPADASVHAIALSIAFVYYNIIIPFFTLTKNIHMSLTYYINRKQCAAQAFYFIFSVDAIHRTRVNEFGFFSTIITIYVFM